MANPLLNMLNTANNSGLNNMSNMIQQFMQFKNSFTGNPQEQVQSLLNSGKMTQDQFNQLSQMAKQIESFLPKG